MCRRWSMAPILGQLREAAIAAAHRHRPASDRYACLIVKHIARLVDLSKGLEQGRPEQADHDKCLASELLGVEHGVRSPEVVLTTPVPQRRSHGMHDRPPLTV